MFRSLSGPFYILGTFLLLLIQSCGVGQNAQVSAKLSQQKHPDAKYFTAYDQSTNTTLTLDPGLCYFIHITGPGLNQVEGSEDACGPESGQGQLSPRAYKVGETAVLTLSATNQPRNFELIGFQSPLTANADQSINCGTSIGLSYKKPVESTTPQHTSFEVIVNNQRVSTPLVLFYSGEKASLSPGRQEVTLYQWPKSSSNIVKDYTFGKPYYRQDSPTDKPTLCLATGEQYNPNTESIFATSGAGLSGGTINSSNFGSSGLQLIKVQSAPHMLPNNGLSIQSNTLNYNLNLGLPKITKELQP